MSAYDNDRTGTPPSLGGQVSAKQRLQGLSALPPLPLESRELLRLLSDPDLDMLQLVDLVERTPALAARILGVANSPFFKSSMPVRSISDAIIRLLGLNLVRDLCVSMILSQPFDVRRCRWFEPMRYWTHAMMSATFAQALASVVRTPEAIGASEAYLGGLLHSLGLLALVHVVPDDMERVFREQDACPERSLCALERELVGMDHPEAGARIARSWHLPDGIAAAMIHHRDDRYRGDHWPLVAVVTLADKVSKDALGDELPSGGDASHRALREALGMRSADWDRVVERWQRQIVGIEGLAAILARSAS